jgi:hypothetical protein
MVAKDLLCDGFQETVEQYLIRHRSVIDVMSKLQEATARVNRALVKSVTNCGCTEINASKQRLPATLNSLRELRDHAETHFDGVLCEHCREALEREIGATLFYVAAFCNIVGLNLSDVLEKEYQKLCTLGFFSLS